MTTNKTGREKPKLAEDGWKEVLDAEQIGRAITRISHEILERNQGVKKLAIVGIRTRGDYLAKRIVENITKIEGKTVPYGVVDITLYRDDISHTPDQPEVLGTDLPFNIDDTKIVLVDDVLFTGRTVRSALDAIIDFGRPISVQLAVLCDRGHRELPIRADFAGKSLPTSKKEVVEVCLVEVDGVDGVFVRDRKKAK